MGNFKGLYRKVNYPDISKKYFKHKFFLTKIRDNIF